MKLLNVKWTGKRIFVAALVVAGIWMIYQQGNAQRQGTGSGDEAAPAGEVVECRVAATVDGLNIRAEPATNAAVVGQLANGEEADAQKVVQDGFRKLDEGRWVALQFVRTVEGC